MYKSLSLDFNNYSPVDYDSALDAEFLTAQGFYHRILSLIHMKEHVVISLFIQEFLTPCFKRNFIDFIGSSFGAESKSCLKKLFCYDENPRLGASASRFCHQNFVRTIRKCLVVEQEYFFDKVRKSQKPIKFFFFKPASYDLFKLLYGTPRELNHYKVVIHEFANNIMFE